MYMWHNASNGRLLVVNTTCNGGTAVLCLNHPISRVLLGDQGMPLANCPDSAALAAIQFMQPSAWLHRFKCTHYTYENMYSVRNTSWLQQLPAECRIMSAPCCGFRHKQADVENNHTTAERCLAHMYNSNSAPK